MSQEYLDTLRAAYAHQYAEGSDEWTADPAMRCFPALVQGRLKLPPHTKVLDIGCGAGHDVEYLAQVFDSVTGIDLLGHPNWNIIEQANGSRATLLPTDLLSYVGSHSFDLVLDNGCFHHQHVTSSGTYLQRVGELMSAGGHFVISTFKNPTKETFIDRHGRIHSYFRDEELRALLAKAQFTVMAETDVYRAGKGDYYRLSFCRRGVST